MACDHATCITNKAIDNGMQMKRMAKLRVHKYLKREIRTRTANARSVAKIQSKLNYITSFQSTFTFSLTKFTRKANGTT